MKREIVLASGSPRRRELLGHIVDKFTVVVPQDEPPINPALTPAQAVLEVARHKGLGVQAAVGRDKVVISADTVVVCGGEILGKPKDAEHAREMLRFLSGKTQTIYTAVWVLCGDRQLHICAETLVEFYPLTDGEIDRYIQTGEPLDKAGAYGIQGDGMRFVKSMRGDYFNVVGFPILDVHAMLREIEQD